MIQDPKRVIVIGGCGHVGLPFGTVLADNGYQVTLLDINEAAIACVNEGRAPFIEKGIDDLLMNLIKKGNIKATNEFEEIKKAEVVVIVTGTPLDDGFNPDLQSVLKVVKDVKNYLDKNQIIILRSTVYPGTTNQVFNEIREFTENIFYCPERIAEGFAIEEIRTLPQIIGTRDHQRIDPVKKIFESLGIETLITTYLNAELAKLLTNTWRYVKFAVANEMWMLLSEMNVNFDEIYHLMTHNYPRTKDLPRSGFAGGPCLIKDARQTSHYFQNRFNFANIAFQVNNGLPISLIKMIEREYHLSEMTVGILGMAFKKNSDDKRSSLAYELKSYLDQRCKRVLITDPHIKDDPSLVNINYLLEECDFAIIGAPHLEYENITTDKKIFNIW